MDYLLTLLAVSVAAIGYVSSSTPSNDNPMAMYYYTQWAHWSRAWCGDELKDQSQFKGMTHAVFAFHYPDASQGCIMTTADNDGDYSKVTSCSTKCGSTGHIDCMKEIARERNVKIGISYGGWTLSYDFSTCAQPSNRGKLVNSIVQQVNNEGWDFLEFDWEYPYGGGNDDDGVNMHGAADDWNNYKNLILELRTALNNAGKSQVQIGSAFGQNPHLLMGESPYVLPTPMSFACEHLDYVGLMSYDLMGGWDVNTGWPCPLHHDPTAKYEDAERLTIEWHATQWKNACGANFSKVILGLPAYGKGWRSVTAGPDGNGMYEKCTWTGPGQVRDYPEMSCLGDGTIVPGTIELWDVEIVYKNDSRCRHYYNEIAHQDFFYCPGPKYETPDVWFAYDGPEAMYHKMKWFKEQGGGGFMVWEAGYTLLTAEGPNVNPVFHDQRVRDISTYRWKNPYNGYLWKPYEDAIWAGWNGQAVTGHTSEGIRVPAGGTTSPVSLDLTDAPASTTLPLCIPRPSGSTDAPTVAPTNAPTVAPTNAPPSGSMKCYGLTGQSWWPNGCDDPLFCNEMPGVPESACSGNFRYWTDSRQSCNNIMNAENGMNQCL